jgi:hypothetical protein
VSLVHLSGWMVISQYASHCAAESRSCWSLRQSSCVQTDLIIMDFAKAFDKVPRRLPYKLQYYGIQENTLL